MCEVQPTCTRRPMWWVQSPYEVINILACPTHLQQAVHAVHNFVTENVDPTLPRDPETPYVSVRKRVDDVNPHTGRVTEVWR